MTPLGIIRMFIIRIFPRFKSAGFVGAGAAAASADGAAAVPDFSGAD
jgi:hypothetical protein